MQSMTGYGRDVRVVDDLQLTVELRSVNHRHLDVRTRATGDVAQYGQALENLLKPRLTRGRVEISLKCESTVSSSITLQEDRAASALTALRRFRDINCPGQEVPLSLLSTVPDLFAANVNSRVEPMLPHVTAAGNAALEQLLQMRKAEGVALATDLMTRVAKIRRHVEDLLPKIPAVVDSYRARLHSRIATLLSQAATLDAGRLEHEVVVFADRVDIAEELTRLQSHCTQFETLTSHTDTAVGRRLEFLLQEMGREVNTVGSKVSDLEVTDVVIDVKAELERMREQVQNVL